MSIRLFSSVLAVNAVIATGVFCSNVVRLSAVTVTSSMPVDVVPLVPVVWAWAGCAATVSPWLAGAPRGVPLTTRERQVAALASGGYSDQAIAQRLKISSRTVQTHLAHVYRKLGINRRSDLRDRLGL